MAFALKSKSQAKTRGADKSSPKRKSDRERHSADSQFGFEAPAPRQSLPKPAAPPVIQTKLKIGEPNDSFEQEADEAAEEIMRMPDRAMTMSDHRRRGEDAFGRASNKSIQRKCAACAKEEEEPTPKSSLIAPIVQRMLRLNAKPAIQRFCVECAAEKDKTLRRKPLSPKALAAPLYGQPACVQRKEMEEEGELLQMKSSSAGQNNEGHGLSPATSISDESLKSGGFGLGVATRRYFETRFNRDLSAVRIHIGPTARAFCESLNAHAFTYGSHVWLSHQQQLSPSFVMAHELAHVVQQTQPPVINNKTKGSTKAASVNPSKPVDAVQRLPFWVPLDGVGEPMSGTDIHRELLTPVQGRNNVLTEAPVPNATRDGVGLDLQGFADLYRATDPSSRVGVYFKAPTGFKAGKQPALNLRPFKEPALPQRAGSAPNPIADNRGGIDRIKLGPKTIELGELKPAALTELVNGKKQLGKYEEGFNYAAELTNAWAKDRGSSDRWSLNSVTRLPDGDVVVAPEHRPSSTTAPDRRLGLVDYVESFGGRGKYSVSKKGQFIPKTYLGYDIPGKLFMEPFGDGLWMYYARPNDFSQALGVAAAQGGGVGEFRRQNIGEYMRVANAVQDEVIGNLKRGPERITLLRRDRRNPAHLSTMPATSQPVIRRKPKDSKLQDHFDQKAYDAWSKRQSELGDEIRGKDKFKGSKSSDVFKKLEFLEQAVEAERVAPSKAKRKTPHFPTAAELKETIQTGAGTTGTGAQNVTKQTIQTGAGAQKVTKETSLDKLYGWLERWTSDRYKILGQFRLRFGGVFVTAVNKFTELKEGIHKKVQEFFDKHSKGKKVAKALLNALTLALKQVVKILVPQTLHLIFQAVSNGVKRKLEALFEDTFIAENIKKIETWFAEIKDYGDKAHKYVNEVKEDLLKKFDWVNELIDDVKWIWRLVKAGRVIAYCKKPLGLGCLRLLKPSSNDLECILCIPKVQKWIAEKVTSVSWFSSLPATLANLIMGKLRDVMPADAKVLRDIFDEKVPEEKPNVEEIEPECKASCSGIFNVGAGGAEIKQGDAEAAKKLAELDDKLSEQEKKDLLEEAERRGQLDKPFNEQETQKLLKELEEKRRKQPQPKEPPKPQEPPRQEPKQPPKTTEQKTGEDKPKAEEKGTPKTSPAKKRPDVADPRKQEGQGIGSCAWSPSQLEVKAWLLEPLDPTSGMGGLEGGDNILNFGTSSVSFNKQPIKRDCEVNLFIKNDFEIGFCLRQGDFTAPIISTEIVFKSKDKTKTLFNKSEEKKPARGESFVEPSWGDFIKLPPILESGNLQIKIKMKDPDTGVVKFLAENVTIEIKTKGKDDEGKEICCNCVS